MLFSFEKKPLEFLTDASHSCSITDSTRALPTGNPEPFGIAGVHPFRLQGMTGSNQLGFVVGFNVDWWQGGTRVRNQCFARLKLGRWC